VNTLIVLVEADDDEGGADADAMAEDSEWEINSPSPSDMPREPPVEHAVAGPSVVRAQQVSLPGRGWMDTIERHYAEGVEGGEWAHFRWLQASRVEMTRQHASLERRIADVDLELDYQERLLRRLEKERPKEQEQKGKGKGKE